MRVSDIPKMNDNDLITELVIQYSLLCLNYNLHRSTKQLETQCDKLQDELVKRGLLTETNLNRLKNV